MSMVIGSVINLKIQMRTLEGQHPITAPIPCDVKYNIQENREPTESCSLVGWWWIIYYNIYYTYIIYNNNIQYLSAPQPGTLLAQSQVLVLLLNARTFPSADEPGQFTFVACTTRKDMKSESFCNLLTAKKGTSMKKMANGYTFELRMFSYPTFSPAPLSLHTK